jgi:UDP-N-acetylglucosamine--N-acetylmuramyl-(pentapeptide) pyrophosphoryl-undecaprenol N-acetylglucosamine transferase
MKIVLTGGGTGGHFFPLIAVAEELIIKVSTSAKDLELYYVADKPFDTALLETLHIKFVEIPAGKRRLYFSIQNFFDLFKIAWSVPVAIVKLFSIYPDVVFSKGGYAAFPVLFAARFLGIPVVIHESDSVPGRVSEWSAKFARRIAVSYPEALERLKTKNENVAVTGQPIRPEILEDPEGDPRDMFGLDENIPVVLVVGGSQGAEIINTAVLSALPKLLSRSYVIHQTGALNERAVAEAAEAILAGNTYRARYKRHAFLDSVTLRSALSVASVVVTRAGSMLFEIGARGVPAVVIPITESRGNHQRENAYSYARAGGGVVIEEANLSDDILLSEIERILGSPEIQEKMKSAGRKFSPPSAAATIASELVSIAESHA